VIDIILLAGSLGARKPNMMLRLQKKLTSKLRLSVPKASEVGDRPVLADVTS